MASNRLWPVPGNPERLMQARIADSELVSVGINYNIKNRAIRSGYLYQTNVAR